jgi:hypothetical protein
MAELKTKPTTASVTDFLDAVDDEERRKDCYAVVKIMQEATGATPKWTRTCCVGWSRSLSNTCERGSSRCHPEPLRL